MFGNLDKQNKTYIFVTSNVTTQFKHQMQQAINKSMGTWPLTLQTKPLSEGPMKAFQN